MLICSPHLVDKDSMGRPLELKSNWRVRLLDQDVVLGNRQTVKFSWSLRLLDLGTTVNRRQRRRLVMNPNRPVRLLCSAGAGGRP